MEKTLTVPKSALFEDVFADVIVTLAELAQKVEIPAWGSYSFDKIEMVHPIIDYHVSLHAGPMEVPGPVVATVYIHIEDDADTAEVIISWDD